MSPSYRFSSNVPHKFIIDYNAIITVAIIGNNAIMQSIVNHNQSLQLLQSLQKHCFTFWVDIIYLINWFCNFAHKIIIDLNVFELIRSHASPGRGVLSKKHCLKYFIEITYIPIFLKFYTQDQGQWQCIFK